MNKLKILLVGFSLAILSSFAFAMGPDIDFLIQQAQAGQQPQQPQQPQQQAQQN